MNTAKNVIPISRDNPQMTTNLPEPLTPADCDLTDWPFMQIDVSRLRDSKFSATVDPAAGFFAIQLWAAAWHRIPAASLPDDDKQLAQLAGLGRDLKTWEGVKEGALYGWKKCSDGRYYHAFVAEKALEAWIEKVHQRIKSGRGNAKRWGCVFSEEPELLAKHKNAWMALKAINPTSRLILKGNPLEGEKYHSCNPTGNHTGTEEGIPDQSQGKGREGKGREGKVSSSNSACAPVPASPAAASPPLCVDDLQANSPELIGLAELHGIDHIPERLEYFKQKCRSKGYKPDNPLETFIQSCREDWAKLNEKARLHEVGGGQKRATEAYWEEARIKAERAKALIFGNQQGGAE